MLFNSWQFAVFLPIVFAVYWILPHKIRWTVLLISSYFFYCVTGAKHVFLLIVITIGSYIAARYMEEQPSKTKKRILFLFTVISCVLVLLIYKYLAFLFSSIDSILKLFGISVHPITVKLLLPLGISFYTFNVIGYLIDVYFGRVPAEKHLGIYALYVAYFPKMIAGPIERAGNLLPQLKQEQVFDAQLGMNGLKRILWGIFKKVVIADTLAMYADSTFNNIALFSGFSLVLAAVFFSIQIYCDFSGYSDIAIGTSELLGIQLMENFNIPYFSSSIKEFWSRWHISLSTWFRDYVYIPLGGNRVSKPRQYFNLMVTFLTSGLWHGANWTFVFWGGLHGAVQVMEKQFGIKTYKKKNILWVLRCLIVFLFATAAWVFFRADSMGDALYLFSHMWSGINQPVQYLYNGFDSLGITMGAFIDMAVFMTVLVGCDFYSAVCGEDLRLILVRKPKAVQWALYLALGILICFLAPKGMASDFVYMQF